MLVDASSLFPCVLAPQPVARILLRNQLTHVEELSYVAQEQHGDSNKEDLDIDIEVDIDYI